MSFELATPPDSPKYTTVSSFTIARLGQFPTLRVAFAETTEDLVTVTVLSMTEAVKAQPEDPTVYTGFVISPLQRSLVGQTLKQGSTVIGVVQSHALDTGTVTLVSAPTTDLTGISLSCQFVNALGVTALVPATIGRIWELTLPTSDSGARNYLLQLMGGFHVTAAMQVLAALGHTHTVEEVVAAVQGLPDNIESTLASAFEQIEKDRRTSAVPGLKLLGDAP